jgi:hypothetical protein
MADSPPKLKRLIETALQTAHDVQTLRQALRDG